MAGFDVPPPPGAAAEPDGTAAVRAIPRAQEQLFAPGRSSRQKYSALVVGQPGLAALLRYEIVVLIAQARVGALGLALRKALYPRLLGSCGRNVVFGHNVVLRHPHKIHIGSNVVIDDHCLLDAKGDSNQGIRIGDGVFVGRNTILSCKNGDIELGAGANLGFNCEVFSASRVQIGANVLMAAYAYVIGGDHDFSDAQRPVLTQRRTSAGVHIGNGAWLGAGAKILDGVTIGDDAVIGAGAVVRDDLAARAIAVGVPARVVGTRDG
jgi:acetyltransferase-like isoleucine patch superfamily enzyme